MAFYSAAGDCVRSFKDAAVIHYRSLAILAAHLRQSSGRALRLSLTYSPSAARDASQRYFFSFFFSAFPRRLIIEEPHCPALFYLFILPLTNVTGRLILLNEVLEQLALATQVKPPGCSKRTASISFFFLAREPEDATW